MPSFRPRSLRRTLATATLALAAPALLAATPSAGATTTPSPTGTSPARASSAPTATASPEPETTSPSPTAGPSTSSPSPTDTATPTTTDSPTATSTPPPTPAGTATPAMPSPTASTATPSPSADVPPTTAPAPTAALSSADARISSMLEARATTDRFGRYFSGTVLDVESGQIVWAHRRTAQMLPASNAKLFTAATALDTLGPDATFRTLVRRGARANHVVLVGTGDPLLNNAKLATLARETKAYLDAKGYKNPQVFVDDYFFPRPSLAYGWKESYVIDSVTPVRPLVRNNRDIMDTSADAGRYLAARLRALGIPGARYAGRQDVASWRTTLADVDSFTVAGMVRRMVLTSDNDVAEILLRRTSYGMRNGTGWSGAKATQTEGATALGTGFGVLYDGSGLSRADRLSTYQLAKLLRTVQSGSNPELNTLRSRNVMPTAGRTGTLKNRFTSAAADCAVGKVWAKTGTLGDTVALSGWTTGTDGRTKVFSFLVNRKTSSSTLKANVDMLAATVNGCY